MHREVIPALGNRAIEEIRKRDLITLIESIADRGSPVMANRVLAHTKRLFRWAAGRDLIETDPAAHIEKPAPERDATACSTKRSWWRFGMRRGHGQPFGAGVDADRDRRAA